MSTRRLLLYLGLNVLVSATATLTVLWVWDQTHAPPPPAPTSAPVVLDLPTAAPAPTAGPPPSATPTVHVVQSGDTLGSIAVLYNVSVEDLMRANGLTDPNVLDVGQTLLIPVPAP